ncbi:hypothetical protein HAX54_008850, partial [Datura stramonium]|nr:hypothetical protein [Datura stramonium]
MGSLNSQEGVIIRYGEKVDVGELLVTGDCYSGRIPTRPCDKITAAMDDRNQK